ncbi:MAG: tRNA (guanosine(37)-N1)-methyltransferase TrmD [Candidatus Omnitrophota bacterium]
MLLVDILTIFPNMFTGVLSESILKRAIQAGILKVRVHNIRDYSKDKHHKVDDKPFGGGPGMVMQIQPICDALEGIAKGASRRTRIQSRIVLLSPQGRVLTHKLVKRFAKEKHLVLLCGHYEGIDERVRKYLVTDEISIGDYVLTGGELPAMVFIDAITRFLPGALGDKDSVKVESFSQNLLEYPHYTRPADFRGMKVPQVLTSGDHKAIEAWREKEAKKRTLLKRPDLIRASSH